MSAVFALTDAEIAALTDAELNEALALMAPPPERFSPEALSGGHSAQLAFVKDRSRRIHVMCARQAGKSWADVIILIANALERPNTTNIFLGLNSVAVRMNIWEPIVSRLFDRFVDLDRKWFNETRMLIRFPNGSRIIFGGYDDFRHIRNLLGGRLDGGVVVLDEAQEAPALLSELLDVILPPMLTPTSRVILSGTIPDTPAGRFYEERKNPSWSHHNWGRLANIHTPEAREQLTQYLADTGISEDDPQIQRDWFGNDVFDPSATAYRYSLARNGYVPTVPEWLTEVYASGKDGERTLAYAHPIKEDKRDGARHGLIAAVPFDGVRLFSFAIDPGADSDRASIEGTGWGDKSHDIQQVFEWSTPRGMKLTTGQIFAVAALAQKHYSKYGAIISWVYDAGSSQNTIDNLETDYRLPLILAAKKADLKGQVDRVNDLAAEGRSKVIIGSALEQDYQRARWDKNALLAGQRKWAASWHPDPSEAHRYSVAKYFDAFKKPSVATILDNPLLRSLMQDPNADRPDYR